MWFSKGIETYTDDNLNRMPFTLKQLKDSDTPELRQFTLKLLRNADINIDSYEIDAQYIDDLPKQIREMIGDSKAPGVAYNVMTGHTLQDNRRFFLDLADESLGTQNLFCLKGANTVHSHQPTFVFVIDSILSQEKLICQRSIRCMIIRNQ